MEGLGGIRFRLSESEWGFDGSGRQENKGNENKLNELIDGPSSAKKEMKFTA